MDRGFHYGKYRTGNTISDAAYYALSHLSFANKALVETL